MTTTVRDNQQNLPTTWYSRCSGDSYENFADTLLSRVEIQDNDKESRVRPSDLIAGMSSQGLQYERRTTYGFFWKQYGNFVDYSCTPSAWRPYYIRSQYNPPHGGEPYDWNWPLKLRTRLEEMQVNLGESLAEYRETVAMYGDFARTVKKAAHKIGKVRSGKISPSLICEISDLYLQYTYGIKPVASDLGSAVGALQTRLGEPIYKRLSTRTTNTTSGEMDVSYSGYSVQGPWQRAYKGYAVFYLTLEAGRADGVSFGNPVEWVWELIPFSFVVDWGIDIGGWLGALDALQGVKAIRGTVSHKRLYRHRVKAVGSSVYDNIQINDYFETSHKRDLYTTIPLPGAPAWNPSASWKKLQNMIAILTSLKCSK